MIVSYPNYLDQTQAIGINGVIQWHGESGVVATPFPLCITIASEVEYGITIASEVEYGITIASEVEYGITISYGGCS